MNISNIKIKCSTKELRDIQHIAFENGLTWPNGSTNVQIPMGTEHYIFMDNEYLWSESADAYNFKTMYEEVSPSDYINSGGSEIPKPDFENIMKNDDLQEFPAWSDEWETLPTSQVVQRLIKGDKLQGKMYDDKCYLMYDDKCGGAPFRFVDENTNYNSVAGDGVWHDKYWKIYVPPRKMTLKEIEKELGYSIEVIDE